MDKEYITDIIDNLRASEKMLKTLEEGKDEIRMRTDKPTHDISIYLSTNDITITPSEPLYNALKSAFKIDVNRWKMKLQDALEITGFDPRLVENK